MHIVTILKVLTITGLLATLALLVVGIVNLFKTSHSTLQNNQLMRWRVIMQAVTLLLFAGLLFIGRN